MGEEKINKETTLAEILGYSELIEILAKYNLPCLSCPFAQMEMQNLTIENICKTYKIDLDSLLKDLNNQFSKD